MDLDYVTLEGKIGYVWWVSYCTWVTLWSINQLAYIRGGISMGKLQKKFALVSNLYQFWVCQRHMTCTQPSEHCRWENVLAETAGSDTTDFLLWFCGKTAAHSFQTPCHSLVCLFCAKLSLTLGKGIDQECHWYLYTELLGVSLMYLLPIPTLTTTVPESKEWDWISARWKHSLKPNWQF